MMFKIYRGHRIELSHRTVDGTMTWKIHGIVRTFKNHREAMRFIDTITKKGEGHEKGDGTCDPGDGEHLGE
jgi:hypothetical protein